MVEPSTGQQIQVLAKFVYIGLDALRHRRAVEYSMSHGDHMRGAKQGCASPAHLPRTSVNNDAQAQARDRLSLSRGTVHRESVHAARAAIAGTLMDRAEVSLVNE